MGWIIFVVWMVWGLFVHLFSMLSKDAEEDSKEKKNAEKWIVICMWVGMVGLVSGLLYGLGWVWYYFCCGFLVFEDPSFGWKIIWGLTSLIPLGFIIGLIAIFLGWNPFKD